jgi:hypothetical protein
LFFLSQFSFFKTHLCFFFFLSICKSNTPLASVVMNLKYNIKRKHTCDIELFYAILSILYIDKTGST